MLPRRTTRRPSLRSSRLTRRSSCAPARDTEAPHRASPVAAILQNWRGKPLVSHQVNVRLIGATTKQTGLTVRGELDASSYPKSVKITDAEMATLAIERDPLRRRTNASRQCQLRTTLADARGDAAAGLPLLSAGVTAPAGITAAPAFSRRAVTEAINSSQLSAKDVMP
jgi:hypothetical protein